MRKELLLVQRIVLAGLLLVSPAAIVQAQSSGDLRVVLAGDANLHRRLSEYDDVDYLQLFNHLKTADVRFVNFETLVHPVDAPGAAYSGGIHSYAPAWITDEFKWAGFNLLSVANNHQYDYGSDGLRSSLHALDEAGLTHAGAGENLAFARAPVYLDTNHGRVALIAAASTLTPGSWASQQRTDIRGRIGVNPLRYIATYTVNEATFNGLSEISRESRRSYFEDGVLGLGRGSGLDEPDKQTVQYGGAFYRAGKNIGVRTVADPDDLEGLLASVREAHREADLVIVSIHAHQSKVAEREVPPDFIVEAAHAAIDAGADIFAVHGPHVIRGIEIYKGKLIFYSLGNFAFDGDTQPFLPSEPYEGLHLGVNANTADVFDVITHGEKGGMLNDTTYFESYIAEASFGQDHKLKQIVLNPISLGLGESRAQRGRPRPASPAEAKTILERTQRLSDVYGTKIQIVDNRGVIQVDQTGK